MKKLILISLFIPLAGKAGLNSAKAINSTLVQVRTGEWPISLERIVKRSDTSYFLQFRDQQVTNTEVLDTLPFADKTQLIYFEQALSALKKGSNGDIANFKDYSIKRAEARTEGKWYILRYQWGMTNFQQPEADIMISTIRGL
jgi:hypothetical protein